jgi:hypothetical protein
MGVLGRRSGRFYAGIALIALTLSLAAALAVAARRFISHQRA